MLIDSYYCCCDGRSRQFSSSAVNRPRYPHVARLAESPVWFRCGLGRPHGKDMKNTKYTYTWYTYSQQHRGRARQVRQVVGHVIPGRKSIPIFSEVTSISQFLQSILEEMPHKIVKQFDGRKVCEWCGDEKGVNQERACPHSQPAPPEGKNKSPVSFSSRCVLIVM
jgi:hypothetical protein